MDLDFSYSQSDFEWLQDRWLTIKNGHTGVQFGALLKFSQPLWKLYDLHSGEVLAEIEQSNDFELLDAATSVMESARLIWAYAKLDSKHQRRAFHELSERMLGENPDSEERDDFHVLLSTMQTHYVSMPDDEKQAAEHVEGYETLNFDELIEVFAEDSFSPTTEEIVLDERYGPQHLVTPDALALFAQPLLDKLLQSSDADLTNGFEDAMNKASDYWDFAQSDSPEQDLMILKRKYASTKQTAADIEAEINMMKERFFTLFPEKK